MKRRVEVSTRKKGYARCKSLILPGAGKYRNAVASGLLSCPDFCESDCTSTRRYRVTVLTRSHCQIVICILLRSRGRRRRVILQRAVVDG